MKVPITERIKTEDINQIIPSICIKMARRNLFEHTVDKPSLSYTWCGQNSKIGQLHGFISKIGHFQGFVPKHAVDKSP